MGVKEEVQDGVIAFMTTADVDIPTLATRRESLVQRLTTFRRHVTRHLLFAGVARVLAELVAFCILSLLLDRWLRLSLPTRLIFLLIAACAFAGQVRKYVIVPLNICGNLVDLAAAIDRARKNRNGTSLAPRVATVLELPTLLDRSAPPSAVMIERAVVNADDALRNVDFESNLDARRHQINYYAIIAMLVLSILLILTNHRMVGLWARRWFGGSSEPWPQATYLSIYGLEGGKIIVPRGEPFTFRVTAGDSVVPENVSLRMREGKGPRVTAAMSKFAANDFRYDLPAVLQTVTVEAEGGDDDIGPIAIEPVDRPRIKAISLTSQHPTEKQPTVHDFSGQDADLAFLPKTNLKLELQANVPIAEAKISGAPAEVKQIADDRFVISWEHSKPVAMQIELVSSQAKLTSLPTPVTIGLKIDQPPRVSLSFTGVRQRITPMAKIPLTILARDDYGVADMALASKAEFTDANKKEQSLTSSKQLGPIDPIEQEIQQKFDYDVTALKLLPNTILSLSASAVDQCYQAPQTASSRPATFRIVAPEELFREILLRQQGERAKFRKQIDEATKLKESLDTLTSPQGGVALARQHRNVQREVQRIGTALGDSIEEMRLNGLGTPESYKLMQDNVLTPLKQMDTDLMIPQRDALDALSSQTVKLDDISSRQDQIIAKMNQILKQMSQWDSFVDVLNQLNEIIRLQEGVKVGTEDLKTKQTEDVFDK
jgi:hypothetical protein